jgi:hypothetical protein
MRTSLWVVIALVSGLVGFLMGYSVSSYTGIRSLEKDQEMAEKDAPATEEKDGGQPSGVVQKAQVEEEKAGRPAETAAGSEAGGGSAAMPASPKTASPKAAPAGRSGGRSIRKAQAKEGTKATGSSAGY